jgi:hypothetical protein
LVANFDATMALVMVLCVDAGFEADCGAAVRVVFVLPMVIGMVVMMHYGPYHQLRIHEPP